MKKLCLFLALILFLQRGLSQVNVLVFQESPKTDSAFGTETNSQPKHPHRLLKNTGIVIGASLVSFGLLCLLPEESTSWHKKEFSFTSMTVKWKEHITTGPVWDGDKWLYNYVLHPYAGALYYMGARGAGYRVFPSFIYSTIMSTVLWEYGIEAFAEVPSTQDLIITPVAGSLLGEGFYTLKNNIKTNHDQLFGLHWAGAVTLWLIDPLNQMTDLLEGGHKKNTLTASGAVIPTGSQFNYYFTLHVFLGVKQPLAPAHIAHNFSRYPY